MKEWESVFTDEDRELLKKFRRSEIKPHFGKKPALIIVDVMKAFLGSKPESVLESAEEYRTSCGDVGWDALQHIKKLLDTFRTKGLPVIYSIMNAYDSQFAWGADKYWGPHEQWNQEDLEVVEYIKPLPSEPVIRKTKASGFLFTPLAPILHMLGADCLVIVGTSTSGCVRATVIDGLSYKYNVFIVEEGCFDRFKLSHLVSLWDMNAKYGEVISISDALDYLSVIS